MQRFEAKVLNLEAIVPEVFLTEDHPESERRFIDAIRERKDLTVYREALLIAASEKGGKICLPDFLVVEEGNPIGILVEVTSGSVEKLPGKQTQAKLVNGFLENGGVTIAVQPKGSDKKQLLSIRDFSMIDRIFHKTHGEINQEISDHCQRTSVFRTPLA